MTNFVRPLLVLISLFLILVLTGFAADSPPPSFEEVLSWLPPDTESLIVARGPFALPPAKPASEELQEREQEKRWKSPVTAQVIAEQFQLLPLSLLTFGNSQVLKSLAGRQVLLAVEGSRHFRPPKDLGEMPYEGCAAAIFEQPLGTAGDILMSTLGKHAVRVDTLAGQKVPVFEEKFERDIWTIMVAHPSPQILLVATNKDYLREVLQRMSAVSGPRALPSELPEWKQVDSNANLWGLRHYDRSQGAQDPSSPFGGKKAANEADEKAVGVVFKADPVQRTGLLIKLSDNVELLEKLARQGQSIGGLPAEPEQGVRLKISAHLKAADILEEDMALDNSSAVDYFQLAAEGALGHGTYF